MIPKLWLRLLIFLALCVAFVVVTLPSMATVAYDGQSHGSVSRDKCAACGFDWAKMQPASESQIGFAGPSAFLAIFSEFLAADSVIANPVPSTLARVIPNGINATTLGAPGAADVFVTDAAQLEGLNAQQIAAKLAIPESPSGFQIIQFQTPESGLASPVFRSNPGFIGGGQTAGGASEFVIPNGPIPSGAVIRTVR